MENEPKGRALRPDEDVRAVVGATYLRAEDLPEGQEVTMRIKEVRCDEVWDEKSRANVEKLTISFCETPVRMVVIATNRELIRRMFGSRSGGWVGKSVTIHRRMVRLMGDMVPGIRVAGSPDIDRDITFDLKLPRKKPVRVTLRKTGSSATKPDDPALPAEMAAKVRAKLGPFLEAVESEIQKPVDAWTRADLEAATPIVERLRADGGEE